MSDTINRILFGIYPYIAISVFFVGSLVRFELEQYSWRSGSSQLLRRRLLRVGSNCFHIGVLFILFGHFFGLLTPAEVYHSFGLTTEAKQMLAMVSGGIAGVIAIFGLAVLIYRRLSDPRILATSSGMDIAILLLLFAQLALGLVSIHFSAQHLDGSEMLKLAGWAQHLVTLQPDAPDLIAGADLTFKLHVLLGLTIFLIFPFSRLVHIWSAPVGYIGRRYQVVRRRERTAAPDRL